MHGMKYRNTITCFSKKESLRVRISILLHYIPGNVRSPSRMAISRSYPSHFFNFCEKRKHFDCYFSFASFLAMKKKYQKIKKCTPTILAVAKITQKCQKTPFWRFWVILATAKMVGVHFLIF